MGATLDVVSVSTAEMQLLQACGAHHTPFLNHPKWPRTAAVVYQRIRTRLTGVPLAMQKPVIEHCEVWHQAMHQKLKGNCVGLWRALILTGLAGVVQGIEQLHTIRSSGSRNLIRRHITCVGGAVRCWKWAGQATAVVTRQILASNGRRLVVKYRRLTVRRRRLPDSSTRSWVLNDSPAEHSCTLVL